MTQQQTPIQTAPLPDGAAPTSRFNKVDSEVWSDDVEPRIRALEEKVETLNAQLQALKRVAG